MKDFCIMVSGISGPTIAHTLSKKYSLDTYDRARSGERRLKPPLFLLKSFNSNNF